MKRNIHISTLALALSALVGNLSFTTTAKADSWTNTGAMSIPRQAHAAALLPNGKVLVAGGSVSPTSVELYDPGTGTWTATNPLNTGREDPTATLLPNGKVLVVGGYRAVGAGSSLSSTELYDPATGTWTPSGTMSIARYRHTATLLTNGKVLVAGGYGSSGPLSSAELYDPANGGWTPSGVLSNARYFHTATLLTNGTVLVAGGSPNGPGVISSAELYNPATGMWTVTGAMNNGRGIHTAALLTNGKVLVAGGGVSLPSSTLSSAELYDPATGVWTLTGAMRDARWSHTATLLPNGKLLVAGGYSTTDGVLSSAEMYSQATGTWAQAGTMIAARQGHTSTLLLDGKVLAVGGSGGLGYNSAELYESVVLFYITAQPRSQIGYLRGTVSFSVSVTNGTPPYSYQWLKGTNMIVGAINSALVITNLQSANEGSYKVVIADATGSTLTSQPATLTVNPAGVSIALYAGVTIDGVAGQTYGVQSTLDLSNTNSWAGRANVTLTNATQLWYDSQPATQPQTYYRVVPGPISIP